MSGITQKKDFKIQPQKRNSDAKAVIATASNAKEVFSMLTNGVRVPSACFFRDYEYDLVADKETFQELFNVADRTFQYWSNDDNFSPKPNHYAVTLLTLNLHPNLRVERR